MANIAIKKDQVARPVAQVPYNEWEPSRWMRNLLSWDPFREMVPFPSMNESLAFMPAFEVKETKDGYVFKADVPGIKEKDLDVTVTGNRLTVHGKREAERQEQGETFYAYERNYGTFSRSFTLPEGADIEKVYADLKDGVLTLTVPRVAELQPKKIDIKTPAVKS